jgi:hypothetical protein
MEKRKTMSYKNLMVLFVLAFTLVLTASTVIAATDVEITSVEVNGIEALGTGIDLGVFSGEKIPVLVRFEAMDDGDDIVDVSEDVRVKAWISGDSGNQEVTERFDVIEGNVYTRVVYLEIPEDLNEELDEARTLEILIESKDGIADQASISFHVQRESYTLEILSVNMNNEVHAGDSIVMDVVLKNKGRKLADDTFLLVRIPELGLETRTYFGDLSPVDQSDPDKEDAVERRTFLKLPSDVPAGLYSVVLDAFNSDSFDSVEKKVLVVGSEDSTLLISSTSSKTFSLGETEEYTITLVNKASSIAVYDIVVDSPKELSVDSSDSIVVVPAGSSRTVTFMATTTSKAESDEQYSFNVIVTSETGSTVGEKVFRSNIDDGEASSSSAKGSVFGGDSNTAVLLTVILAIVFVVLLVVLIVLLTKKPEKSEEFGESYY